MNAQANNQTPQSHSANVQNFWYTAKMISHPNIIVGEYTYGIPSIWIARPDAKINIGRFCSIGAGVSINIYTEHDMGMISTYPFPVLKNDWPMAANNPDTEYLRGNVVIGNDVWIGSGSIILGGVTVGDGAVIGANAVVAKDVAPYSIVVGNPAREVRKRFSQDIIDNLLEIKWWDWPHEKIQKYAGLLASGDFEGLKAIK
jgi:acetyltransferase-like isoleucine patch superfamily enzyme